MKKVLCKKRISSCLTIISFLSIILLLGYSISDSTGAWFSSKDATGPNIFVVEIPVAQSDSAWSDGEAGFQKSYFSYTKDSPEIVKIYFIQNPQKRFKIGDITVWNDSHYLYLELNTTPRPDVDPELPGGKMVTSKHHITLAPNQSGHTGFSEEYHHNSSEAYIYTYLIPLSAINFNDENATYISVKIEFIKD